MITAPSLEVACMLHADNARPDRSTLTGVIGRHAAQDPRAVAVHFFQGGKTAAIRREDLLREAGRAARFLRQSGVEPGEVVLIVLRHSPDLIYSFLGAMLAGAIPSFMPPLTGKQDAAHYWDSHRQLFARIGRGTLLTSRPSADDVRRHLPDLGLRLLIGEEAAAPAPDFAAVTAHPDDTAFLQHSSGTTGLKKGVALSHTAVLRQIDSYAAALRLAPSDCIVSWLPLYHDMGLIACFLLPLLTGTPLVLMDPFEWVTNPGLLFAAIKRHRGTLCWLPNFAFHHLCRAVRPSSELDLSSMRMWIDCSEPCRAETFECFARIFAGAGVRPEHLQVSYAMAETVFAVTQTPPGRSPRVCKSHDDARRPPALSAGPAIAGLEILIRGEDGKPLPDGQVGEITITGHCLFTGYFRLAEQTRRKLRDGWYYSGDLGFMHEGELFVTGRKNDLIIVHGRNYYAHELEFLVNRMPGVHPGRTVAIGWFRPEVGSEEVVLIAECDDPASDPAPLVRAIKQTLLDAAGLLVFDVRVVAPGWLVKTTSGKISRTDNLQKYLSALTQPTSS